MNMNENFSQRLKSIKLNISYFRKKSGLTQEQLAGKIEISRTHLSNIEAQNMKTGVSLELLYAIADALDIDISNYWRRDRLSGQCCRFAPPCHPEPANDPLHESIIAPP